MSHAADAARAARAAAPIRIAPTLLLATLAGCGGGGGGSSVAAADAIALAFPPARSLTDQPGLKLLGTTARPRRVARIDANGIPGTTGDGFAHWEVDVALSNGSTPFDIAARDAAGGSLSRASTTVESAPIPEAPVDLAFDAARNVVLIADLTTPSGLLGLDLSTGRPVVVSGPIRGSGPDLGTFIGGVAIDPVKDRAFVLANISAVVDAVDLRNGDRSTVSDSGSSGVKFSSPRDLALDATRSRLVVADLGQDAILAVDIATGARSILSDATHGAGPALDRPQRIVVADGLDLALVITRGSDDLIGVKLSNGDRSVISGANRGSGPALQSMKSVTFDTHSGLAIVANGGAAILSVDLATGNRTLIVDDGKGAGPSLVGLGDLFVLPDQRLVAIVGGQETLLVINPSTGDRSDLETLRIGAGARITHLIATAAEPDARDTYILETDFLGFQLSAVDPSTGDRSLLSSPERGGGPDLVGMDSFAVADRGRAAYVPDFVQRALFEIDLESGDRRILSDDLHGSGLAFSSPKAVVVDEPAGLAFVGDDDFPDFVLIGVDLASGNRTEFSGPHRGAGPFPNGVRSLAVERSGESILALDEFDEAIVRFDLATGDRSFVSGQGAGAGPDFTGVFPSLALSRDRTHALVSDRTLGLVDVDLQSGERRVVASNELALGPSFGPIAPFSSFSTRRVFATHGGGGALVEIDLDSGNRVVISR